MIYLDNSATTKQREEVTEAMLHCMRENFGNPSSLYSLGLSAEKAVKAARSSLIAAMGISDGNVYFTSGGTEADNTAIFGAAKALRRRGDKIVTTAVEHPAVLECCRELESRGFRVEYVGVDGKCGLDMERLRSVVDGDTILVSVMHVNNEVGTIMPVGDIKRVMREKNSPGLLHVDAVQSFGKLALCGDADMISVSGHKIHGPKGIGALYVRNRSNIPPFILGGGQEKGNRSGTENVPAIAGFGAAADIAAREREAFAARASEMRRYLMDGLSAEIDDMVINSPEEAGTEAGMCCGSLLSVSFPGTRGEVLLHTLEQDGIFVSTGSACSSNKKGQSHVLKAMGLDDKVIEGTLRFSFGGYNDIGQMDIVTDKVAAAVKRFRRLGSFR